MARSLVPALVALSLPAGCADDGDDTTAPESTSTTAPADEGRTIEGTVTGGTVEGGVRSEAVAVGDALRLEVTG